MADYYEQLLKEFVDREVEMSKFCALLDSQTQSGMVLCGDGGVGKSSLLAKMNHEVAQRKIPKAEIIWTDSRLYSHLDIMRKIRDDLGVECFQRFTDLVNYYTVPAYELNINVHSSGISVASGMSVNEGSRVGDVAGVLIKDMMLTAPRFDKEVPESERRLRLTDAFVPCLADRATGGTCVIFLDATEKMDVSTEAWLWQDLIAATMRANSRVKFVLSGRKQPQLDRS